MKKIKRKLQNTLFKWMAIRQTQGFFEALHKFSLKGMNYGSANKPEDSGELSVLDYIADKEKGDLVIFDVGSNNGQYLKHLIKRFSGRNVQFYCFEPDPVAHTQLLKTAQGHANVKVFNIAFGNEAGTMSLYQNNSGSVGSSLVSLDEKPNQQKVDVQVMRLDAFCKEHQIVRIDFLKVDTEGFEGEVLKGATELIANNKVNYIQLEHGSMQSIKMGSSLYVYQQMLPKFRIYHIKQNGLRRIRYSERFEIFYNSNYFFELIRP
ncbi:MAG: FkbM family methyltransferase [Chitinophagaceae bacterium]|nr:FkbM family methyltransferase [Chitinophagaceae bacterium]